MLARKYLIWQLLTVLLLLSASSKQASSAEISCSNTPEYDFNVLRSPAYVRYNTFLAQRNFLELGTSGANGLDVLISLYNPAGRKLASKSIKIPANSQRDIDVNQLLTEACKNDACPRLVDLDGNSVVDTYGLIELEFDDSDASTPLIGRLSNYRPETNSDSFSFAFARDLSNSSAAYKFAIANTIDPTGGDSVVQNWLEVTNIKKSQEFRYELFDAIGRRVLNENFTLAAKATIDLAAGHQLLDTQGTPIQGAYLAKITPVEAGGSQFIVSISRYAVKNQGQSFAYAFNAIAQGGNSQKQYFFAGDNARENSFEKNYLEIANTSNQDTIVDLSLHGAKGELMQVSFNLAPRKQRHVDLSAILESFSETSGRAELSSDTFGSLIAQSASYYFDQTTGELQTAYLSEKNAITGFLISGGTNTFLDMQNELRISSIGEDSEVLTVNSRGFTISSSGDFQPQSDSMELTLASKQTFSSDLQELNLLNKNSYGVLSLRSPSSIKAFAEILRIRRDAAGKLDFVMPIKVRAPGILEEPLCSDL